jgi:hypothetical protein
MKKYKHVETEVEVEAELFKAKGDAPKWITHNTKNIGTYLATDCMRLRVNRGQYFVHPVGQPLLGQAIDKGMFEANYGAVGEPAKPKPKSTSGKISTVSRLG